jgi:UDP-N-acetylmuramoylalanine--D-glutamate ligase
MRLVVLGGGESGVGTAILGMKKGYDVFVSDYGKIKENYKEVLINNGIAWEEEKHTEELILNADVVMKSPGIPEKKSVIVIKLIEKGIPVISEIEFAAPFTKAITIGITGSNGKVGLPFTEISRIECGLGRQCRKEFRLASCR